MSAGSGRPASRVVRLPGWPVPFETHESEHAMSDWFDDAGNGSEVDVEAIMDSGVPAVLWEIVTAGALVSMGKTSDGGALGVTVTLDGKWRREYFRDSEEMTSWLLGARDAVRAALERPAASSGSRRRTRRS